MNYVDELYYKTSYGGLEIPDAELLQALKKASQHIDILTYNRIVGKGITALTEFQQDIVREVCCQLAEFEYNNSDVLENILQSYGINGVNMSFGQSWNVHIQSGVAIRTDIYMLLCQTGLCQASLGV